jgi:hypothetical protein
MSPDTHTSVSIRDSKAQHVAGRDINISVTLQLRRADLRTLLALLGQHMPGLAAEPVRRTDRP